MEAAPFLSKNGAAFDSPVDGNGGNYRGWWAVVFSLSRPIRERNCGR